MNPHLIAFILWLFIPGACIFSTNFGMAELFNMRSECSNFSDVSHISDLIGLHWPKPSMLKTQNRFFAIACKELTYPNCSKQNSCMEVDHELLAEIVTASLLSERGCTLRLNGYEFIGDSLDNFCILNYDNTFISNLPLPKATAQHYASLTINRVKDLLMKVAMLHNEGMIHGLINPDNIFIQQKNLTEEEIKLGRFATEEYLNDCSGTGYRDMKVDAKYLAPEILMGEENFYTYKIDLYSLGITIYEMLEGPTESHTIRHNLCKQNTSSRKIPYTDIILNLIGTVPNERMSAEQVLRLMEEQDEGSTSYL